METVECLFSSMDILISLFVLWSLMPPFQMVRTYKKKSEGGRANYATSEAMVAAYNSVIKKEMSANQASIHYRVNKKSLLRRVRGEVDLNAHVGQKTAISSTHEQELAECLKLLADWGWGFSKSEVKDLVQEFCQKNSISTPFKDDKPGRDWFDGFMKRNPTLAVRKSEQLSSARA